jgi:hypothetical protein
MHFLEFVRKTTWPATCYYSWILPRRKISCTSAEPRTPAPIEEEATISRGLLFTSARS